MYIIRPPSHGPGGNERNDAALGLVFTGLRATVASDKHYSVCSAPMADGWDYGMAGCIPT